MNPFVVPLLALVALAAPAQQRERSGQHTAVVAAPVSDVWRAFTTSEGVASLHGAAKADVELRLGGAIRKHDDAAGELGDARTSVERILAYEPERMLSLRAEPNEGAEDWRKSLRESGWSVLRFEPLAPDRTRVSITALAAGVNVEPAAFELFDATQRALIDRVALHFGGDEAFASAGEAWKLVQTWCGGEWICEAARTSGGVVRSRVKLTPILGGSFVLEESWLGDERKLERNARTVYGIDPATGGLAFWSFEPGGGLAQGSVRVESGARLVYEWRAAAKDGSRSTLACETTVRGPDEHVLRIFASEAERAKGATPGTELTYRRVAELPESFKASLVEEQHR
jgi:uncharacterized protein YndB with AHSA1/START domain